MIVRMIRPFQSGLIYTDELWTEVEFDEGEN